MVKNDKFLGYEVHYSDLFTAIKFLTEIDITTDNLYNSLLPLDVFSVITLDMLRDNLHFPLRDINVRDFELFLNKDKFITYYNFLIKGNDLSSEEKEKCSLISRVFIKAGIERINSIPLDKESILLPNILDSNVLDDGLAFYVDCISFNYKKLEMWSKQKRNYKCRNLAIYRLGKHQQLFSCIEKDFQKLYPKNLSEIDFYIFKLNYDYAASLSEKEQRYIEYEEWITRKRNQKKENLKTDNEPNNSDNLSVDGAFRQEFDENRLSETNKYEESSKTINKTNQVDLNKINASKLFDNMSIEFRTKYPFMKNWLDCPFSKRNINTIHSFCNKINSLKENNSVSTFDYSNQSLKYVVNNLLFLIANGILNDKSINWKNTVIDVLRTIVTKIDVSALEKKSFLEIQDVVVFDYKIFFLYIEYFSSKDLISLFNFNKIRKLYCGEQNEELNSIEKSIKNLLNYARQNEDDFKDFRLKDHGMHLVQKVKNLIVISSYLSLSSNTINNLVDFILKYTSFLLEASEELYLFLSSILKESQRDNSKLKKILTIWLKDNFAKFLGSPQNEVNIIFYGSSSIVMGKN